MGKQALIKRKISTLANNIYLGFCYACRRLGVPGYEIHQIHLPKERLIYIPIPKNACSSVKHFLYEIEFDQDFDYERHREWGYRDIHDYYNKRSNSFTGVKKLNKRKDETIFAIVRDPVKRLISCYRNRVVVLEDLQTSKVVLEHMELPVEPDLNTFVMNLKDYRRANNIIEHHSRPQHEFLGDTLDYLDRIFPITKIDELENMLRKFKEDAELRSEKSGGPSYNLQDLSSEALDQAVSFYEKDYDLLNEYYSQEQILNQYEH